MTNHRSGFSAYIFIRECIVSQFLKKFNTFFIVIFVSGLFSIIILTFLILLHN